MTVPQKDDMSRQCGSHERFTTPCGAAKDRSPSEVTLSVPKGRMKREGVSNVRHVRKLVDY